MIILTPFWDVNWAESIAALASLFGTFFLIKTFKEQQRITKIQQKEFQMKFLPIFKQSTVSESRLGNIKRCSFYLEVEDNPAYSLT